MWALRCIIFLASLYILINYIVPLIEREIASRCFTWILSVVLAYAVSSRFSTGGRIDTVRGKAVLVTGCDTGIGNALARHLDRLGFRVFAGCLFADRGEASKLDEESSDRLKVVQLDVTSDQQVADAVASIGETLSSTGDVLWGVVNNAGTACFGFMEWVPLKRYKQLAEVNLWGMIRVTKAALPLIRKSKGRVVNMSSMLGRYSPPSSSAYSITKYGVQALTDCLRGELYTFGINAVIIEPGNFSGSSAMFTKQFMLNDQDKLWSETPEYVKEAYGEEFFTGAKTSIVSFSQGSSTSSLDPVMDACEHALTDKNPRARYFPGNLISKLSVWYNCYLPSSVSDLAYQMYFIYLGRTIKGKQC
ncbi:D-beta-hydroxybutyrate dehydrogenase, mitochondrial-like [Asterias amurensis]|uniref:D-beta-hydroxybutyrate dehydrogenase, mitochondrial-like n=1 Tax=Asterias amurensis TaxID=7602 RepID=UPI003AB4CCFB